MRLVTRDTRQDVFPVPGPATTLRGLPRWRITRSCSSVNRSGIARNVKVKGYSAKQFPLTGLPVYPHVVLFGAGGEEVRLASGFGDTIAFAAGQGELDGLGQVNLVADGHQDRLDNAFRADDSRNHL